MYTAANNNEIEWENFHSIRREMVTNPFIYYVSVLCLHTFKKQVLIGKITEEELKLPYPAIYDIELNDAFFKMCDLINLLKSEKEILRLFVYLKTMEPFIWMFMHRLRILYTVFCFFREYLFEYSKKFNENLFFQKMFKRFVEQDLILNLVNYEGLFLEKRNLEIKMLEFDLNAYFEKESVFLNMKNGQVISEIGLYYELYGRIEQKETCNSDDLTSFAKPIYDTSSSLENKDITYTESNLEKNLSSSDSKIDQTPIKLNKKTDQNDLRLLKLSEIQSLYCNKIYKSDTKDVLKLDLEIFFQNLFCSKSHIELKNTEFSCYKNSELYKKHKEMCEKGTLEANEILFSLFYKLLLLKYEKQWKNILSSISTVPHKKFSNILAYLDKFTLSSDFQRDISKKTFFISIGSSAFPKMYLDEIVLVLDIDNTLFPTSYYEDKYPDFGTPGFYKSQNNIIADPNEENPKKGINYQEIKSKFFVTQHVEYRNELKKYLEKLPFKKICFTNAEKIHAEWALKTLDILDCFVCIVHREELYEDLFLKPYENAYFAIEQLLETKTSNIYFYDDIDQNVQAAKYRGWNSFLVGDSLIDVLEISLSNLH
ncbi:putative pyrimidine 5'-nucleotidase [Hamiltosporidium tvaerminnensis]|uniref:Putative pyrimidine 5'-nucleotidase n=1 Tax=Hamiltosporidium tvaerminnensis TaxID=1176355 RepID=A0A4Q9LU30_9MICR|nr:putative pyrimidine 5'-nucleotidase [Hamiltosporidium tvaerminnensis]